MRIIAFISLFLTFNLWAQGPHACSGDVQKFCQGVPKTKQALDECLDKNQDKLGPSCKEARANFAKLSREKNKCFDDIKKFCADKKDIKSINQCLMANETKLSKECIAQKEARLKANFPCKQDQEKFCAKDKLGSNSLTKCMQDNHSKFSKQCQEARNKFEEKLLKKQPCFKDAIAYCDAVKKDPAKLEQCLDENKDKLSAQCTKIRKKVSEQMSARNPCYQDAITHCAKERYNPDLLKTCLEKNHAKLSKSCQDIRTMAARQQKNIKEACAGDEKKFCVGVPKKGNAIVSCLKSNLGRLSFQCRKAITD